MTEHPVPLLQDRRRHQVVLELRHCRLRLAIAENELAYAQGSIASGHMDPDMGLEMIDTVLAGLCAEPGSSVDDAPDYIAEAAREYRDRRSRR
ncbi:MAG: hypothetical protein EOS00_19315 [Mesorhizobium sp.]|nr:MAG: hypothetical protein EOS00_19315 [Mesorhizobium sp.]